MKNDDEDENQQLVEEEEEVVVHCSSEGNMEWYSRVIDLSTS